MFAIVCDSWGPPSSLQLREVPGPVPGAGQLRVRTRVAAVNFPDALMVAGKYQMRPEFPFSPGGELSGEVVATGDDVSGFAVGDKVACIVPFGAYAQEVLVDATNALKLPADTDDATLELAGSFLLTYGTSYHALKDRAQARAGETLLVLGAGGGVGLAAVELGKRLGLRVIAAGSSDANKLFNRGLPCALRQYSSKLSNSRRTPNCRVCTSTSPAVRHNLADASSAEAQVLGGS